MSTNSHLFYKKKQELLQYLECDFVYLDHSNNLNNPNASCKAENIINIIVYANFQLPTKENFTWEISIGMLKCIHILSILFSLW